MVDGRMTPMPEILAGHPLFSGLGNEITDLLAGCARNVHFGSGTYLFKEDEPADLIYLVRSGEVALELRMPGRGKLVVDTVCDGEVVGASWFLPPYRWRFDARAVSPIRATSIDAGCLRDKCDAEPALGYQVFQRFLPILARRLQSTRLRMIDLYAPPAEIGRAL